MDMVDILFHVETNLSPEQRDELEQNLREPDGVLSVHFNAIYHHLLTLEYDPEKISSAALLERANQYGVKAHRIGL